MAFHSKESTQPTYKLSIYLTIMSNPCWGPRLLSPAWSTFDMQEIGKVVNTCWSVWEYNSAYMKKCVKSRSLIAMKMQKYTHIRNIEAFIKYFDVQYQ